MPRAHLWPVPCPSPSWSSRPSAVPGELSLACLCRADACHSSWSGDGWGMRHPELKLKIPAKVIYMSWCPDFEFRGTCTGLHSHRTDELLDGSLVFVAHRLSMATPMVGCATLWEGGGGTGVAQNAGGVSVWQCSSPLASVTFSAALRCSSALSRSFLACSAVSSISATFRARTWTASSDPTAHGHGQFSGRIFGRIFAPRTLAACASAEAALTLPTAGSLSQRLRALRLPRCQPC